MRGKEALKWITHGGAGDIVDLYTTLPWATLCEAVACIRIGVRKPKIITFRMLERGDVGETPAGSEEAKKERATSSGACGPG